jgi:hypothetical protein
MNRIENALDIVVRSAQLGDYDSNVIGMAAEVIAEEVYRMKKTPRGSRDVDGHWYVDGNEQKVQVKAWSEDRVRKYRQFTYIRLRESALPDVLLCILVYCSKPDYKIIYNGPPREVGYVEKNGLDRVIRFGHMMSDDKVQTILGELRNDEPDKPEILKIPLADDGFRKLCSICGQSFGIDQFTYGNRSTNSYCKTCRKEVGAAYSRGGTEAADQFRQEMRSRWKS